MSHVRSKQLCLVNQSSGSSDVYTVPSGTRTLVKRVLIHNGSSGTRDIELHLGGQPVVELSTVASHATLFYDLGQVLNEGQSIKVVRSGTGIVTVASGSEFLLT